MADDLRAEQTPGFRVGEKKTLDEYNKLGRQYLTHVRLKDEIHVECRLARICQQDH